MEPEFHAQLDTARGWISPSSPAVRSLLPKFPGTTNFGGAHSPRVPTTSFRHLLRSGRPNCSQWLRNTIDDVATGAPFVRVGVESRGNFFSFHGPFRRCASGESRNTDVYLVNCASAVGYRSAGDQPVSPCSGRTGGLVERPSTNPGFAAFSGGRVR